MPISLADLGYSLPSRYGGRPNPYDQRGAAPTAPQGNYNQPYGQSAPMYSRNNYDSGPSMGHDGYVGM